MSFTPILESKSAIAWKDFSRFRGSHSVLSASQHGWLNDDKDTILQRYASAKAAKFGTYMHAKAAEDIEFGKRTGIMRPANGHTYETYVNDGIRYRMRTEEVLYFNPFAFVTCDAISFRRNLLRVHDLKTGQHPADMVQLYIYAAYFCLMYNVQPANIQIETRIYQNDEVRAERPGVDLIVPIMDKLVTLGKVLETSQLEEL